MNNKHEINEISGVSDAKHEIKSLFCYGNEDIKKMIWSLKTNSKFCESVDGKKLSVTLQVEFMKLAETQTGVQNNIIVICAPSSSFWQSKKTFDHMHAFMKKLSKTSGRNDGLRYIPFAIIPRLHKKSQKGLNKVDRQELSLGAYSLSNYFKYFLRNAPTEQSPLSPENKLNIIIIDDVKTTGSTLKECSGVVEKYLEKVLDKQKIDLLQQNCINIQCLTIAYEA